MHRVGDAERCTERVAQDLDVVLEHLEVAGADVDRREPKGVLAVNEIERRVSCKRNGVDSSCSSFVDVCCFELATRLQSRHQH